MAKYQRKTKDLWDVIGTYPVGNGFSFETVTTCTSRKEAKQAIQEYRENDNYAICFAIKKYRVKV